MILFLIIAALSFFVQFFLPWWSMAVVAFAAAFLLGKKAMHVFLAAFSGCGLVWLLLAVYIHFTRGDLMTNRIAVLLSLHGTLILYAGTFLVAAIVGGMAGLAGFYLREIFRPKKLISGTW